MRFWLSLALCLGFTSSVFASETRLGTLRDPMGIKDETQTFVYPAMVNEYSLALVELGTRGFNQVYGGAIKEMGGSAAGLVVSRDEALMTSLASTQLSLVDEWHRKPEHSDPTHRYETHEFHQRT